MPFRNAVAPFWVAVGIKNDAVRCDRLIDQRRVDGAAPALFTVLEVVMRLPMAIE